MSHELKNQFGDALRNMRRRTIGGFVFALAFLILAISLFTMF